jgi:serine protease Do/serine protease DegQ
MSTLYFVERMTRKFTVLLALSMLVGVLGNSHAVATALPSMVDGNKLPTLANVVEKVERGIVNISTRGARANSVENFFEGDDFFRRFFQFDDNQPRGIPQNLNLGSGVIIDAEKGYVLTNHHLLSSASQIQVTLSDGRISSAEVVGTDPAMDLALLKIPAENLQEVIIGDSDELRVGDFVLALGNNYGLEATVTSGIISALGRSGLALDQYQEFIQTDAAINPGSSGGALVNLRGEVIGINTAILAPTGGNIGIGFAIPINTASSIVHQITEFGRVKRGVLGIHYQELNEELAEAFNLDKIEGVLVVRIIKNSAAEQAGLQDGDVLTHVNGERIIDGSQLRTLIALIRVGQIVNVKFIRDNTIIEGFGIIGDSGMQTVSGVDLNDRLDGAEFQNADSSATSKSEGIVVSSVREGSSAWQSGIREEDIILEVNRLPVNDVDEFKTVVQEQGSMLMLKVRRQGESRYMVIG